MLKQQLFLHCLLYTFTGDFEVNVTAALMQDSVWPVPCHIYVFAQQRLLIIGAAE
jgi:hypothetical protein